MLNGTPNVVHGQFLHHGKWPNIGNEHCTEFNTHPNRSLLIALAHMCLAPPPHLSLHPLSFTRCWALAHVLLEAGLRTTKAQVDALHIRGSCEDNLNRLVLQHVQQRPIDEVDKQRLADDLLSNKVEALILTKRGERNTQPPKSV